MIVLITGATGGLGKVLGNYLAAQGMTVYGTSRDPSAHPDSPFPLLALQAADPASIEACFQEVVRLAGGLDVLVNCVNELIIGRTEEVHHDEVEALYRTNVFGVMQICSAALPYLRGRGGGLIVNMSSLGGILAVPYMGAYTSAKFALEAMTEALYHEVRSDNIDVVIMQPVAMYMDRPATGNHLHLARGVGDDSFSHNIVRMMARDTAQSRLTPELVAARIHKLIGQQRRPLRVPMDRAKVLGLVKRLAPQKLVDRLIAGVMKDAASL